MSKGSLTTQVTAAIVCDNAAGACTSASVHGTAVAIMDSWNVRLIQSHAVKQYM